MATGGDNSSGDNSSPGGGSKFGGNDKSGDNGSCGDNGSSEATAVPTTAVLVATGGNGSSSGNSRHGGNSRSDGSGRFGDFDGSILVAVFGQQRRFEQQWTSAANGRMGHRGELAAMASGKSTTTATSTVDGGNDAE